MADLAHLRSDLRAFAAAIGLPSTDWQADAMALRRRVTAVAAPRQSGKSRSLAVVALHRAFTTPNYRVLAVSASEDASRRLLAEAARVATRSRLLAGSVVDETASLLTLTNGSEVRSVPASEKAVRGWAVDLLVLDEASQLEDAFVTSACLPTTAARPDARIVFASSPGAMEGVFYETWRAGVEGSEHVESVSWSLEQATWIGSHVIAAAREQLPEALFEREYLGRFSEAGLEEAVIPRAWVEAAQARSLEELGGVAFGLDVARLGSDSTVCARVCGGVLRVRWSHHGADLMATTQRMAATLDDELGRIAVDATGVGAGVLDRLRELGYSPVAWIAAGRARRPDRFANRKAEDWWRARELFREGQVDLDPADRQLAGELAAARYTLTSAGLIQIVAKRDMGGPSPDRADAAVIALAAAEARTARLAVPTGRGAPSQVEQKQRARSAPASVIPSRRRPGRQGGAPEWQRRILKRQLARPAPEPEEEP